MHRPDIPLCPRHHKLADLGKIPASELYRLKKLEQEIQELIYEDRESMPWEGEYHQSSNFQDSHDFLCYYGRMAFQVVTFSSHQDRRSERISTWLNSSPEVGTYFFQNQMFSYLRKRAHAHAVLT